MPNPSWPGPRTCAYLMSARYAAGCGFRCALGRYGVPFRRLCAANV